MGTFESAVNSIKSVSELPKRYSATQVEEKWKRYWEERGVFHFRKDATRERIYSVDTPPPTVSGDLHIGHVFSYAHQDFIVRYKRMQGFEVFYPFGFDDNGLPTERLVEKTKGVRAAELPRDEFIKLCHEVSQEQESKFKDLWQAVGLSCDWSEVYTTISERSRRISQRSFLHLLQDGHLYRKESPTLWCPECRTAIAQAEIEDQERDSEFYEIIFTASDGRRVPIATTRPELLPACVAVFVHPDDARYQDLIGKNLQTPHFNHEVEVMADELADPEKGTGIVMCCTFGDTTDIDWWQRHHLDTRVVIDERGRLNEHAQAFAGMSLDEGRRAVVEQLREGGFLTRSWSIQHPVNCHERCGTPLEFLITRQWYVRLLDKKEQLVAQGAKCRWFPEHMGVRYRHWVENLKWDWGISRQRYFGVPFPVWYCADCDEVIPAREEDLPVNPLHDAPPVEVCPHCGSSNIVPEKDVLDTWATSSLTPQLNTRWGEPNDRSQLLFPMSLRPQAHDIIRTWAFYTIVKAYLHTGEIPWFDVVVSGHAQDSSRHKISKSKGKGTRSPRELVEQYSADVIRYWAASAKLGTDTFIDMDDPRKDFEAGKRLVTKLYNASKLALRHLIGFTPAANQPLASIITHPVDRWAMTKLTRTVEAATRHLEEYDFAEALAVTERFFWNDFCDNYLELVKGRLYGDAILHLEKDHAARVQLSAKQTLYVALESLLKLFAPFIPFITEEIWHWYFAGFSDLPSVHLLSWPRREEFADLVDEELFTIGEDLVEALALARKAKSELGVSIKKQAKKLTIGFTNEQKVNPVVGEHLKVVETDLLATANVDELEFKAEVVPQGVELESGRLRGLLEMEGQEKAET
ncbi:MAG: valine--tRNA ligase [Planctomycetales bacterium 4484_113]|nr:MAG: valine--tRNA ligase [Planctomycetales bacterium 4484_113]